MEITSSDKKKLLALPFSLIKRTQKSEPKKGQWQWNLFRDTYGEEWDKYEDLKYDEEQKITEFDYENFIPQEMLEGVDTTSEEFKKEMRRLHLNSRTAYERH